MDTLHLLFQVISKFFISNSESIANLNWIIVGSFISGIFFLVGKAIDTGRYLKTALFILFLMFLGVIVSSILINNKEFIKNLKLDNKKTKFVKVENKESLYKKKYLEELNKLKTLKKQIRNKEIKNDFVQNSINETSIKRENKVINNQIDYNKNTETNLTESKNSKNESNLNSNSNDTSISSSEPIKTEESDNSSYNKKDNKKVSIFDLYDSEKKFGE